MVFMWHDPPPCYYGKLVVERMIRDNSSMAEKLEESKKEVKKMKMMIKNEQNKSNSKEWKLKFVILILGVIAIVVCNWKLK